VFRNNGLKKKCLRAFARHLSKGGVFYSMLVTKRGGWKMIDGFSYKRYNATRFQIGFKEEIVWVA
jgi:hypothetical protein